MDDLISRQAAIDSLHMHLMYRMGTDSNKKRLDDWINGLPSAQETHEKRTETHACDLISRAEAIELKPEFLNPNVNRETKEQTAIDRAYARGWNSCNTHWIKEIIEDLPSVQPERLTDYSFEESCTDCPAYDTENHRCPRFNQVIRTALKDANLEPCENCISRQAANTKIKKYRKKPIVIEAYQTDVSFDIETLEGIMRANVGDYIITGVNGEQYPCKPDIFKKTYEEISDE